MEGILYIGSGVEDYRYYIFKTAREMGLDVFLIKNEDLSWEGNYIDGFIKADLTDSQNVAKAIQSCEFFSRISGITTYIEEFVPITSYLCHYFGFPGISIETFQNVRNKFFMRECFYKYNVPSPRYMIVKNIDDLSNVNQLFAFPLIIKPIDSWSSIGVVKVNNMEDLKETYHRLLHNKHVNSNFLVEEYLDGDEISIEGYIFNGKITLIGITKKLLSEEPYFEEIGHDFPCHLASYLEKDVLDIAKRGIMALQIDNTIVHVEMRLTNAGPKIVEIGGRLGGDCIPLLAKISTGIDLAKASIDIALNKRPIINSSHDSGASIRILTPKKSGRVIKTPKLVIKEEYRKYVFDFRVDNWCKPGEVYLTPPEGFFSRLAYIIVKAKNVETSSKFANQLLESIEYKIQ